MLEFKRRVLKFNLDDKDYELNYPTVKQVQMYSKEYSESLDQIGTVMSFLERLGLESMQELLLKLKFIKSFAEGRNINPEEYK